MEEKILTMRLIEGKFGVCRLDRKEVIPEWIKRCDFVSITRTLDELSIVCSEDSIPDYIKREKDWKILKVEGPLDFSLIGILSSISTILANKKISIFAISTYDTDYILIKDNDVEVLSNNNYEIIK
ncbi:putative amino acid-binding ACT domain-containing protein [Gottschalkia acidurici 9a]|uniref:Amino acid-binding ACT domain-containing protein n=1 Tax=Gottschalkia acidurici (strain ATCC 7906 / DSM 604 / BCRC 14475 / CIP 104303 / KCTC 5404 / NCIMB 10678 / 9a) TaxID=1128398 RepID=K0B316_GOTA9|nr:ACT domain-containing protein [Gottschalkia acidurici]AFS79300.1 putative amino acid-binding ACT domain-containing protein [Gottschalkia acidurici 9a]